MEFESQLQYNNALIEYEECKALSLSEGSGKNNFLGQVDLQYHLRQKTCYLGGGVKNRFQPLVLSHDSPIRQM